MPVKCKRWIGSYNGWVKALQIQFSQKSCFYNLLKLCLCWSEIGSNNCVICLLDGISVGNQRFELKARIWAVKAWISYICSNLSSNDDFMSPNMKTCQLVNSKMLQNIPGKKITLVFTVKTRFKEERRKTQRGWLY